MSALNESNSRLEGNKLHISLMLKVPLDIEVELGISPTIHQNKQDLVSQTEDLKSAVVMSEVNQVEFEEQVRILSNQIVTQLFQEGEVFSTLPETQILENLPEQISTYIPDSLTGDMLLSEKDNVYIEEITQLPERQKRRFVDSLNDGLTLAVNVVGTALFLGKLANYSWE
ncbi:hypothetical protein NIES4075_40890 [Tolypothrix sp. NIES-4075]|uniref:hypothetical protein n=1 Tax=Tolypothrix sp. NIES-4075 TaxID=2005459 RepID=UPI000B5CF905|nr:hypothetical protein [Tolypothrix sp. NIES-4075]GAX43078.1 hypothetical protein NIES4075_40890 [Tolypothrix sp. NIES-4075]